MTAKYNFCLKKKNVPEVSQFSIHSGLSPSFYPHLKIKLVTGLAVFKAPWWASMCAAWSFPSSNPVFMLLQISNVISITLPFHVFQTPQSSFRITSESDYKLEKKQFCALSKVCEQWSPLFMIWSYGSLVKPHELTRLYDQFPVGYHHPPHAYLPDKPDPRWCRSLLIKEGALDDDKYFKVSLFYVWRIDIATLTDTKCPSPLKWACFVKDPHAPWYF